MEVAYGWDRPEFGLTSDGACKYLSAELTRFARKAGSTLVSSALKRAAGLLQAGRPQGAGAHQMAAQLACLNLGMEIGDFPALVTKTVRLLRQI